MLELNHVEREADTSEEGGGGQILIVRRGGDHAYY